MIQKAIKYFGAISRPVQRLADRQPVMVETDGLRDVDLYSRLMPLVAVSCRESFKCDVIRRASVNGTRPHCSYWHEPFTGQYCVVFLYSTGVPGDNQ